MAQARFVRFGISGQRNAAPPRPRQQEGRPGGSGCSSPTRTPCPAGDRGAGPGGEQLKDDSGQQNRQVAEHRDVVAVHSSTRNQPRPSQAASTTERPAQVLSTGSVSVLIVGWA